MTNQHRNYMYILDAHGISWDWADGRLLAENIAMVDGEPVYTETDITDWAYPQLREWLGY